MPCSLRQHCMGMPALTPRVEVMLQGPAMELGGCQQKYKQTHQPPSPQPINSKLSNGVTCIQCWFLKQTKGPHSSTITSVAADPDLPAHNSPSKWAWKGISLRSCTRCVQLQHSSMYVLYPCVCVCPVLPLCERKHVGGLCDGECTAAVHSHCGTP